MRNQNGDSVQPGSQGISDFFERERTNLVAYVRKSFPGKKAHEAEDLVQDVFLRLWEGSYDPIENLAAYVYRALDNRLTDFFRSRSSREISLDQPTNASDPESASLSDVLADLNQDQVGSLEGKEREKALFLAIDRLPAAQKAVLIATEFEEWTFEELSELWDEPLGTLLSRKHRAVQSLRKQLKRLR